MYSATQPSSEQLLVLLQEAIRTAPSFDDQAELREEDQRWLAHVCSILESSNVMMAAAEFRLARRHVGTNLLNRRNLLQPIYDGLSHLELQVPATRRGAFIPPGDTWNGYAALVQLIQQDHEDLLIVDPFLSADMFLNFTPHTRVRNGTRLLAMKHRDYHPGLVASAQRWNSDAISHDHPVEVRYAPPKTLHDRHIILNKIVVWNISQSIKDIAKNSPASVTRNDTDLSEAKALHYEDLWTQSTPILQP